MYIQDSSDRQDATEHCAPSFVFVERLPVVPESLSCRPPKRYRYQSNYSATAAARVKGTFTPPSSKVVEVTAVAEIFGTETRRIVIRLLSCQPIH